MTMAEIGSVAEAYEVVARVIDVCWLCCCRVLAQRALF